MLSILLLTVASEPPAKFDFLSAPAGKAYAKVVPGGTTILPNGRYLTPAGSRIYTRENLWQIALSPDGNTVVGFDKEGLTVVQRGERKHVAVKDLAPAGAFSSDGSKLLVSVGDTGKLSILDTASWTPLSTIELNTGGIRDSYAVDVAVAKDGRTAFALDVANQDLLTIDLVEGILKTRTKAGRQPYALVMSEDGRRAYVANIGMFDYSLVGPPASGQGHPKGLSKPPFGFPSRESREGVQMDGRQVPGLGDELVPDAQSIWLYDVSEPSRPKVLKKVKAGLLIHAPADGGKSVGGSAPNELLLHGNRLYVSNANNDTVQVLDARSLRSIRTIKLSPSLAVAKLRGVIPSGLAMNRAGNRLYVCESGLNSVAVVNPLTGKTLGRIPSGWFPMQIALSPDGKTLHVATQKGLGRGPRGALDKRPETDERYGMPDMPGMIQRVAVPDSKQLAVYSRQVLGNNGLLPRSTPNPKLPSDKIEYVVFITKENHTFDGIFGGLKGSKSRPEYAEFGMNGWIKEKGKEERLPIMPNHIRLAEQFAISDNFYMEPQASGDGHRWLVGVYPSLWTSRVFYAGWSFRANNDAKGRLVSMGSNGSQIPEDYLENGSLWEHLHRNGITFRNYGEGYETPGSIEDPEVSRAGAHFPVNHPMPKVLFDNTCFEFPSYNNHIPDIARAQWFQEDLEKNFRAKGKKLPRFLNIAICNDHGDSPRPNEGYPYVCSYMADNDLALGRIVEWLSHQPEWKKMAIFVTQDDSGADDDHVDRHRSFVLTISPYAKRGYVSKEHTSIMSIIRSIYGLFGLGPNNMFDALATPLSDMFTTKPDFTPYKHVPVDPRVFVPEKSVDPTDPEYRKRRARSGAKMDDPAFMEWLRKRGG